MKAELNDIVPRQTQREAATRSMVHLNSVRGTVATELKRLISDDYWRANKNGSRISSLVCKELRQAGVAEFTVRSPGAEQGFPVAPADNIEAVYRRLIERNRLSSTKWRPR
jgi:hypothetical protein